VKVHQQPALGEDPVVEGGTVHEAALEILLGPRERRVLVLRSARDPEEAGACPCCRRRDDGRATSVTTPNDAAVNQRASDRLGAIRPCSVGERRSEPEHLLRLALRARTSFVAGITGALPGFAAGAANSLRSGGEFSSGDARSVSDERDGDGVAAGSTATAASAGAVTASTAAAPTATATATTCLSCLAVSTISAPTTGGRHQRTAVERHARSERQQREARTSIRARRAAGAAASAAPAPSTGRAKVRLRAATSAPLTGVAVRSVLR